jgi:hypothetical protein
MIMVTKRADQVADPVTMLDKIETAVRSLMNRQAELENEIYRLRRLGVVDAKPHYRDGKYLYLIYPMVDGERKREYIGADPEKIQEALDKIERKDQIADLENKLAIITTAISSTKYYLSQAIVSAHSVRW